MARQQPDDEARDDAVVPAPAGPVGPLDVPVGDLPVSRRAGREVLDRLRDAHAAASAQHAALLGLVADLVDEVAAALGVPVDGDPVETARFGRLGGDPAEAVVTEIALALRVGVAGARRLVQDALALTTVLPQTRAALRSGGICPARAHAVVTGTAGLTPEQARWVDAEVAEDLPRLDPPGVKRKVRALVARLEVDATNRRARYETCRRRVLVQPLGDGAAELVATGPVADITALFHRLDTWARTRTGPNASADPHAAVAAGLDPVTTDTTGLPDRRGVDARRFDALVGLVTDTGAGPRKDGRAHTGQCHGPSLNVSLPTLLGLDDETAWLAGHGAVPADIARELLAAGHPFRRVLTDFFTGKVLGVDGHLHHLPAAGTRTTTPGLTTGATTVPAVVTPTTAPPPSPAPDAGLDAVPDPPGDQRTTATAVPPPTTTTEPAPPGLTDKVTPGTTTPGTTTPGTTTPGTTTPPWARTGADASDAATPSSSTCPLAGLPTDYVPTAEQSRYVRTALPECTHPGCTQPSVRCDLDHQVPHGAGGPTCECNLRPRCRKHHQCRTHYGWQVEAITDDPDDPHGLGTRWTSPLGLVHDDPAPPFLPRPITSRDDDGTPLPTGWGDLGDPLDCSYPTVDMAWPGAALLISAAVTATAHHREPPASPAPPTDDDPPPF
ncbi:HNH endonuclease signature motif containing protein [Pseudokineococcus lusitanus]|uniref:Uncharacterized protein DUF222 n=1 Tax=Pseudokineococcus lusitanus TaxID=763993 RepID=A0A3N1HMZ0_9ACTN|nr:HNH endonuclease signature motif containing protein [Pseudokineococcus lusitanus]ROP43835.1 uncharacterized protein DUF222 [Pseudokineococcus lusitanus]